MNEMELKPTLRHITIYPVKALDGNRLEKAQISKGGCLLHDREYAIIDSEGKYVNGKKNELVHVLRTVVDTDANSISFHKQGEMVQYQFYFQDDKVLIDEYLSDHFGMQVVLMQNKEGRFLDIPDISGLTVVSTESLKEVSKWFGDMDIKETRRRFRATIEIEGVPAFWEDHLFSTPNKPVEFTIGDVTVWGMQPRARCVVPTRDPETGEVIHAFPKIFAQHRAETLPPWSSLETYGHYYYLTVDCMIPPTEEGKWLHVGDEINVVGVLQ